MNLDVVLVSIPRPLEKVSSFRAHVFPARSTQNPLPGAPRFSTVIVQLVSLDRIGVSVFRAHQALSRQTLVQPTGALLVQRRINGPQLKVFQVTIAW